MLVVDCSNSTNDAWSGDEAEEEEDAKEEEEAPLALLGLLGLLGLLALPARLARTAPMALPIDLFVAVADAAAMESNKHRFRDMVMVGISLLDSIDELNNVR